MPYFIKISIYRLPSERKNLAAGLEIFLRKQFVFSNRFCVIKIKKPKQNYAFSYLKKHTYTAYYNAVLH